MTGTDRYAPEVRLVDGAGGQTLIDSALDLVSVRVSLTHIGPSEVTLSLNNQRFEEGSARPWPRYNDVSPRSGSGTGRGSPFWFGRRFRVDMRYAGDAWTPMILARVTDMAFSFPSSGGAKVTVTGKDLLSLLDVKPTEDKRYDQHEIDAIRDVVENRAQVNGAFALATDSGTPWFRAVMRSRTHEKSVAYLEFIKGMASQFDYEVFVDFDSLSLDSSAAVATRAAQSASVSLHVVKARSRKRGAETEPRQFVELRQGHHVMELTPRIQLSDQITEVTAQGRTPSGRARVDPSRVEMGILADELFDRGAEPAPHWWAEYAAQEPHAPNRNPHQMRVTNLDAERAQAAMGAKLRDQARKFMTVDGSTWGDPRLRPGIYVKLGDFGPPFDGYYYVTKTEHSLDGSGYVTRFSARRPGMPSPAASPSGGSAA